MNTRYKKGYYYENLVRKEFEKQGYYTIRSGKSAGLWDIVAISSNFIVLIQSKKTGLPTVAERKAMAEFPCPPNVIKQIWRFYGRGKKQIWTWTGAGWTKEEVK